MIKIGPFKPSVRVGNDDCEPLDAYIPGTRPGASGKAVYFADFWKKKFGPQPKLGEMYGKIPGIKKRFSKEFKYLPYQEPYPETGSLSEGNCGIIIPEGQLFHALSYWGDLEGWRKQVEYAAKELNIPLAEIHEDKFVLSDGRVYKLLDCKVEFYNGFVPDLRPYLS